jgi:hypothetical protein
MRRIVLGAALLGAVLSLPCAAQIQYFGYVGAADDTQGLYQTRGFTNFAHVEAGLDLASPFVRDRVNAMNQQGIIATINLGVVLWCADAGGYRQLCPDWQQRWHTWKLNNASILTPAKVLAFDVLDEPFNRGASMLDYERATAAVKADFPWAKIYMTEAACVVLNQPCGLNPASGALSRYGGTLPNVDWLGLDEYGIHPATDSTFRDARSYFKWRFPNRKWLYVMDGYWAAGLQGQIVPEANMGLIAREWYDVARADPDAILLGVLRWSPFDEGKTSKDFSCVVLREHVAIGRAITGKAKTLPPIGFLNSIGSDGLAWGWTCLPNGTLCEQPSVRLGGTWGTIFLGSVFDPRCGNGYAETFRQQLPPSASGARITAIASDLDTGVLVNLPSACPENPACLWYSQSSAPKGYLSSIEYGGYVSGWVCDPDAPQVSTKVRLALGNGTTIGVYATNLGNEQAVTDECGGGSTHRFSVQLPSWARYQAVYAYAQDVVSGEAQVPWLCDDGWSCIWR